MIEKLANKYIIKFSKREYLEDIKNGKLYFKEAQYFKNIDSESENEDKSKDNHEGTIRVDTKSIPKFENILDLIIQEDTEINLVNKSNKKTPLFCCSIINEDNIIKKAINSFKFKDEYIDEMSQWGNEFIVISLEELIFKLEKKCNELGIFCYYDNVKYDQDERVLTYEEGTYKLINEKFLEFFHKNKKFKLQNEFRIILFNEENKLISNNTDHYILEIGKLQSAKIIQGKDLKSIIMEFNNHFINV